MNYTLMHKNVEAAELTIAEAAAAITEICAIRSHEHMPPGVQDLKGGTDIGELNDWLRGRAIPTSRSGIQNLYARLGRRSTEYLVIKCFGLSLSDHYWIRPAGLGLAWADINFFQNDFSGDVGEILFGRVPANTKSINLVSPDNTSDGWLRKKWIISGGRRLLVKGSSEPWKQEPFNEVIASSIMQRLGIAHVPYTLLYDDAEPYSICENFLSIDTELVTAWRVFHSLIMNDRDSDYAHLLRCCEQIGIPDARMAIDEMLAVDYIIANEDRHYSNFGFVRNAETLEWLGAAPIYDSGASLWHNALDIGGPRKCQPFAKTHDEQLKLVTDLRRINANAFDYESLKEIERDIQSIYAESRLINAERAGAISKAVLARARAVAQLRHRLPE